MSGVSFVTIAVDAMGGDRAPDEIVAGARAAARPGLRILLCGPSERLGELVGDADGLEIVEAPDTIGFADDPAASVRARPRSSLVTACRLVREGEAQAALSAGSTGAMLAASAIVVGRVRGVARPGIAAVLPGRAGPCVLIDAGANPESRAENLLQFGVMGAVFAENVLALPNPRVALVSIGEEASKGTALVREAHALLATADLQFVGNCEGRDALTGEVQVMVADGFTGNVLLKGLEGTASVIMGELRTAASSGVRARAGALLLLPALRALGRRMRPDTYGGAYLLGVRGLVVIAHGNSGREAIANAIGYAAAGVEAGVVQTISARIEASASALGRRASA